MRIPLAWCGSLTIMVLAAGCGDDPRLGGRGPDAGGGASGYVSGGGAPGYISGGGVPGSAGGAGGMTGAGGNPDIGGGTGGIWGGGGVAGEGGSGASSDGCSTLASHLDARIVELDLPAHMVTGQLYTAHLVIENTSDGAWDNAGQGERRFKLGAVDDQDPFSGVGRFELPVAPICAAPSTPSRVPFEITLRAPSDPGTYVTDWRMLKEFETWFGETAASTITVEAGACSNPVPLPLDHIGVVIHNDQGRKKVLDSTAKICDWEQPRETGYCAQIGFTDGRRCCPSRPEGHPEVDVCNDHVMGRAPDTGRVGPYWTYNGQPCDDSAADGTCKNHSENQFLVFVFGPGTARACSNVQDVCGELVVP